MESDNSGSEAQTKCTWSYKRRAGRGSVGTDTVQEPPDIQPKKLSEGKFLNVEEEGRIRTPRKKQCPWKNFTLTDLLVLVHIIENTK